MTKYEKGFTLIELLVVISVIGILSAVGIATFVNYSRQQQLVQVVSDLKNNLRLAQGKSLAQEKPASGCSELTGYELKFTSDSVYTVSPICGGFSLSAITTVLLPPQVKKTAGPDRIRFKVLTGAVEGAGIIEMSGFNVARTIEVTEIGGIK